MDKWYIKFSYFLQRYPKEDIEDIETQWKCVKQKGWITIDKHYCFLCDYSCRSRTSMYSHIETHPKWVGYLSSIKQQTKTYICGLCNTSYTLKRNVRRHIQESHPDIPKKTINHFIHNTIESNQSKQVSVSRTPTIKEYLQKECIPMSFRECIKQYPFSIEDIHLIEWMGLRDGYSLLVKKMFQSYSIQERPIHCTDKKRLTFYYMEQMVWKRDNGQYISTCIDELKYSLIQCINKWVKDHQPMTDNATSYIRTVCMGDTAQDEFLNKKRIIQSIASYVYLTKQDIG